MAFFSDGDKEYFSLNLEPIKNDRSFVYELSKLQKSSSEHATVGLLLISINVLMAIMLITGMETLGLIKNYISESNQELIVIVLAGIATISGLLEVLFFLWIKNNKLTAVNGIRTTKLNSVTILIRKSWMVYVIFLLNFVTPFISLAALPGGLPAFFHDISSYGAGFRFLLLQFFVSLSVFLFFLTRRVVILLFRM